MPISRSWLKTLISTSILFILALGAGCSMLSRESVDPPAQFELAILDGSVGMMTPGLGHSIESSWPVLEAAYPEQVRCRITPDDIEAYHWETQTITLTLEASTFYKNDEQSCLAMVREFDGILSHPTPPFVAVYDNTPVYGGFFLRPIPIATRYNYPVIYYEWVENKLILSIYPTTNLAHMADDIKVEFTDLQWQPIKDERIRELFLELGKLK